MHQENEINKVHGLIAEFDDPDDLMGAAKAAYHQGYRTMDAYSPFPIHGLDDALGIPETKLPWFIAPFATARAADLFGRYSFPTANSFCTPASVAMTPRRARSTSRPRV